MHIVSYFFTGYVFVLPPAEKLGIRIYFPCSHLPLSTLYHIATCHILLWISYELSYWHISYIFMLKSFFSSTIFRDQFYMSWYLYLYLYRIDVFFFFFTVFCTRILMTICTKKKKKLCISRSFPWEVDKFQLFWKMVLFSLTQVSFPL